MRVRHTFEQVRQYVAQHTWLVLLAILLGLGLGLSLLYFRAIFRFALVEAIVKQEVHLRSSWNTLRPLGFSYFFWVMGALVVVGTTFAGAAVAAFPYLRAAGTPSLAFSFLLVTLLVAVVLVGVTAALLITLTDDLVVPLMYVEHLRLPAAWSILCKSIRAEAGTFAAYVLLRFAISTLVGVAVLFFLFLALLGLFSSAILAGALVILVLRMLGLVWFWNPLTTLLALAGLGVLMGVLLILLTVVGMPGQVLLQDFGMRFVASRVPWLGRVWVLNTPPNTPKR